MIFQDRTASRQQKLLCIDKDKQIYSASRGRQDPEALQAAVAHLYSRILELVDETLDLREQRSTLTRERDILSQRLLQLETDLMQGRQAAAAIKREAEERQAKLGELQSLTGTLTEWNSSLELQCTTLTQSLLNHQQEMKSTVGRLQRELLGVTEKQIGMRKELDAAEEENQSLRRSLREVAEVRDRFIQENAILKSKLYNVHTRSGGSAGTDASSPSSRMAAPSLRIAMRSGSVSPPSQSPSSRSSTPPRLINVRLEEPGIGDLLAQLKSYPVKKFITPLT